MSLQRFSFHGEHTHTLTVVAVSLYEQIQDDILHHSLAKVLLIYDNRPGFLDHHSFQDPQAVSLLSKIIISQDPRTVPEF